MKSPIRLSFIFGICIAIFFIGRGFIDEDNYTASSIFKLLIASATAGVIGGLVTAIFTTYSEKLKRSKR